VLLIDIKLKLIQNKNKNMYWSITWDIIGSIYENYNIKTKDFDLFWASCFYTDDTVLTLATADAVLNWWNYWEYYRKYFKDNPWKWYWIMFTKWCNDLDMWPYNSYWNWSAMRVWPIWYAFDTLEKTLEEAEKSAICTHNHIEWIKWAKAIAWAIFLARRWENKEEIKRFIERDIWYSIPRRLDLLRLTYAYNETCQKTVPEAILCFLESNDFEDAIRNAISIWWDSDTLACITWSIAEAFYWVPDDIKEKTLSYLNDDQIELIDKFYDNSINKKSDNENYIDKSEIEKKEQKELNNEDEFFTRSEIRDIIWWNERIDYKKIWKLRWEIRHLELNRDKWFFLNKKHIEDEFIELVSSLNYDELCMLMAAYHYTLPTTSDDIIYISNYCRWLYLINNPDDFDIWLSRSISVLWYWYWNRLKGWNLDMVFKSYALWFKYASRINDEELINKFCMWLWILESHTIQWLFNDIEDIKIKKKWDNSTHSSFNELEQYTTNFSYKDVNLFNIELDESSKKRADEWIALIKEIIQILFPEKVRFLNYK